MVNQNKIKFSANLLVREWSQSLLVLVTIVPLLLAVPPHVRGSFNHIGLQQKQRYIFTVLKVLRFAMAKQHSVNSCAVDV